VEFSVLEIVQGGSVRGLGVRAQGKLVEKVEARM